MGRVAVAWAALAVVGCGPQLPDSGCDITVPPGVCIGVDPASPPLRRVLKPDEWTLAIDASARFWEVPVDAFAGLKITLTASALWCGGAIAAGCGEPGHVWLGIGSELCPQYNFPHEAGHALGLGHSDPRYAMVRPESILSLIPACR